MAYLRRYMSQFVSCVAWQLDNWGVQSTLHEFGSVMKLLLQSDPSGSLGFNEAHPNSTFIL